MQAVVSGYRQPSICICSNVKAGHIDFQSGCRWDISKMVENANFQSKSWTNIVYWEVKVLTSLVTQFLVANDKRHSLKTVAVIFQTESIRISG